MNAYSVYGLRLSSETPIPELLESDEDVRHEADVLVSFGAARPSWLSESYDDAGPDQVWAERSAEQNEAVVGFGQVGRYWVRAGREIIIEPEPGAEPALVRHGLLGPVLAHLLWQRDVFTLHASVLGIAGHHVAFVGVSGEGKSTTAAALETHGHTLVCDDVAALDRGMRVLPGFPRMRLYEDVLRGVGEEPGAHPRVHSQIDKRSRRVVRFAREAVQLERVFVLSSGPELRVEALAPQQAMLELMRHTFCAHQYAPLYGFKQHMERAAVIAGALPVLRLERPKDLARLSELVSFIEAHTSG